MDPVNGNTVSELLDIFEIFEKEVERVEILGLWWLIIQFSFFFITLDHCIVVHKYTYLQNFIFIVTFSIRVKWLLCPYVNTDTRTRGNYKGSIF